MDNYQDIIKTLLAQALKKNYRMSDRQITLLEWNQVIGGTIKMHGTGREVHLTTSEQRALKAMPVNGRFVFSTTPFAPIGAPRESTLERIKNHMPKMPKVKISLTVQK